MSAVIECKVPGCGKMYEPGRGGSGGKCWMHLQRQYRGSRNQDYPRAIVKKSIKGRSPRPGTWLTEEDFRLVEELASELGISVPVWLTDTLHDAVERELRCKKQKSGTPRSVKVFVRTTAETQAKLAQLAVRDEMTASAWASAAIHAGVEAGLRRRKQSA